MGAERSLFDLWAYVIMPEHVHLVLWPHPGVAVSQILNTLKQSVSKKALHWLHQHAQDFLVQLADVQPNGKTYFRFWQRGGGYDRNLRSVSDIYEKIDYIHNNPTRKGLTTFPQEWQWSSCRAWETGVDTPVAIHRQSLPPLTPL